MENIVTEILFAIDSFLIYPFRIPSFAALGLWTGAACLAVYATILGEMVSGLIFLANPKYYLRLQDKMVHAHNLSVSALQDGDKESYTAINKEAHEHFGKSFFANASLGMSSLLPVPFALWWLSLRFEGIVVITVPIFNLSLGYPFIFLSCYILIRIVFSKYKKHLPFFKKIAQIQEAARTKRGAMRSFFDNTKG